MAQDATRLLQEIREQPAGLKRMLDMFPASFERIHLPGPFTQQMMGVAEGSSHHAIAMMAPFIQSLTGIKTLAVYPETIFNQFEIAGLTEQPLKRIFERTFFLAVSQSGRTSSVVKTLANIQECLGFNDAYSPILTFTNNPEGTLCQRYHNHFHLHAEAETSIAATKSMTASMMALFLFGLAAGQQRGWIGKKTAHRQLSHLETIPNTLFHLLESSTFFEQAQAFVQHLGATNQFILLSKGLLATALPEIGLKLTETSSNIVWSDNTEGFKHGYKVTLQGVEAIRPNCIYVIPPALSPEAADGFFQDVHSHFYVGEQQMFSAEQVFWVRFQNSPIIPEALEKALGVTAQKTLTLPPATGVESLFVLIVAFHVLSYFLALSKGENPNNASLQKAVI